MKTSFHHLFLYFISYLLIIGYQIWYEVGWGEEECVLKVNFNFFMPNIENVKWMWPA